MSELHQYEIHYRWTDNIHSEPSLSKTALEWAYSVQEAVFQLELRLKQQSSSVSRFHIETAGPVTKAINDRARTHYHVCLECQKVLFCGGCGELERDLRGVCVDCLGKKPHIHYCDLCATEKPCDRIPCHFVMVSTVNCKSHSHKELEAFYHKKEKGPSPTP